MRVLWRLFRRLTLEALQRAFDQGQLEDAGDLKPLLARLSKQAWVVYAKPPFGGPARVVDHLGHHTHRVAISNNLRHSGLLASRNKQANLALCRQLLSQPPPEASSPPDPIEIPFRRPVCKTGLMQRAEIPPPCRRLRQIDFSYASALPPQPAVQFNDRSHHRGGLTASRSPRISPRP